MTQQQLERKWLQFRVTSLLIFFLFLYIVLMSRAFQLQILSSPYLTEISKKQQAKTLETKHLIKDLQHSLDELTFEQKKQITDTILLDVEKTKLLEEIDELNNKYVKLSNDIKLLQNELEDLSILEEQKTQHIINVYDQIYRKETWFNFIISFLLGIVSSFLASIIYTVVAMRNNMPTIGNLIEVLKNRLIPTNKGTSE